MTFIMNLESKTVEKEKNNSVNKNETYLLIYTTINWKDCTPTCLKLQ